ncbi:hypothetical protein OMK64_01835 [Cellulomonas fimi]|uniref:hypothetical protein n=1 Tax=Cellulomonas fimi TaxID=1708 RepID=UPI00234D63C8|nr:hypothetical protein [Cellulomonas fimi]MDC7120273.1 hypothetical protein [Cellulomonas fimi]
MMSRRNPYDDMPREFDNLVDPESIKLYNAVHAVEKDFRLDDAAARYDAASATARAMWRRFWVAALSYPIVWGALWIVWHRATDPIAFSWAMFVMLPLGLPWLGWWTVALSNANAASRQVR